MNILGIGPGELILIMIILLVVVGPERLPVLARQGGQMLVRVRNWVQKSPDAAMIMRARQEIEQELSVLRSSLLEVQNARDEVMQVAKQVNQTITEDLGGAVKDITKTINDESRKIMQGATDATKAATTATQAAENAASAADVAVDAAHAAENGVADAHLNGVAPSTTEANATPALDASNGQTVARGRTRSESFASRPAAEAEPPMSTAPHSSDSLALVELRMLHEQMQTMLRDMQALQQNLRGRGLLGDDWQAPSSEPDHDHQATEVVTLAGTDSEERPQ